MNINILWSELSVKIADLLRIPQVDHNYRYPKISQLFKPVYFCRYVGDIAKFYVAITKYLSSI